ncbi:MAG: response regulator [Rubrobacteraceae bacterium]
MITTPHLARLSEVVHALDDAALMASELGGFLSNGFSASRSRDKFRMVEARNSGDTYNSGKEKGVAVAKILVVDDEPNIREVVGLYLSRDGHAIVSASDGEEALDMYRRTNPDLVVLDLMLPGLGGIEVCRRIQSERRVPLIMLTARGEEEDRIVGLGVGADDYVVKPFSPRELAARVAAVLRRVEDGSSGAGKTLTFEGMEIDPSTRIVEIEGEAMSLTAREFDLLHHMASSPGRVFTRDQLMEAVWGYAFYAETSTVTVHMRRLREKIEADPSHPRYLQTVWGVGYRFHGG